jgi:hypothetical protein
MAREDPNASATPSKHAEVSVITVSVPESHFDALSEYFLSDFCPCCSSLKQYHLNA